MWHGTNLEAAGDIEGALKEVRRSVELDPLSAVNGGNLVYILSLGGHSNEAIAHARKVLAFDSTAYTNTHNLLAFVYIFSGSPDSGLREMQTFYRLSPENPAARGSLLFAYAAAGRWAEAKKLRDAIIRTSSGRSADPDLFYADLAFGDRAGAITRLEQSFAKGTYALLIQSPGCDPLVQLLKSEPRYIALMKPAGIRVCPGTTTWPIGAPPAG